MSIISEMKQCKIVAECHECATIDANGEDEAAAGWLTCIEEMFSKFEHVIVLGNEVLLKGFYLKGLQVMAKCRSGRKLAFVSLESVEFPKLNRDSFRSLQYHVKINSVFIRIRPTHNDS